MLKNKSKKTLRQEFMHCRNEILPQVRKTENSEILKHTLAFLNEHAISMLLTYVSFKSEVDTLKIIHSAFGAGIRVATPRCNLKNNTMKFFEISSIDDLTCGFHGIFEPAPNITNPVSSYENAACIVPGVAFDTCGMRIGYGGGYYDRFLANFSGVSAGLAFNSQVAKQPLPKEEHDRCLNFLITPQGSIMCRTQQL